jgi:hypothetical protein
MQIQVKSSLQLSYFPAKAMYQKSGDLNMFLNSRIGHGRLQPGPIINLGPRIYLYFDPIIFVFVLLFLSLIPKNSVVYLQKRHLFYIPVMYHLILA